jgi:hypothetical protein
MGKESNNVFLVHFLIAGSGFEREISGLFASALKLGRLRGRQPSFNFLPPSPYQGEGGQGDRVANSLKANLTTRQNGAKIGS